MSAFRSVQFALAAALLAACGADVGGDADTRFVGPPNDGADLADGSGADATDAHDSPDLPDGSDVPDSPRLVRIDVRMSDRAVADLHRDPQSRAELEATVDVDGVVYRDCEIELHGGFARTVPKLSYRIRFDDDHPLVTTLFSPTPETHRRVVLQASWIDPSYIRNCLTFDLVRELGGLAPRCDYVELSFNGSYQGLFVAIERVDAVYLGRNGLDPDGLLVKASNHNANWADKDDPMAGFELHVNEEAPTEPLAELLVALTDTPADAASFAADVEPWLDLDDFTSWQLAHTLADNRDTFTKNYYLHYDWVAADRPFRIISWDADATWGMNWDGAVVDPGVQGRTWGNDAFSPRLFSIPEYRDPYRARYGTLVGEPELRQRLVDDLEERATRIRAAAVRDLTAWERGVAFDDEVAYLRDALDVRFETMATALGR